MQVIYVHTDTVKFRLSTWLYLFILRCFSLFQALTVFTDWLKIIELPLYIRSCGHLPLRSNHHFASAESPAMLMLDTFMYNITSSEFPSSFARSGLRQFTLYFDSHLGTATHVRGWDKGVQSILWPLRYMFPVLVCIYSFVYSITMLVQALHPEPLPNHDLSCNKLTCFTCKQGTL